MTARYAGFLRRSNDGNGIVGEIRDPWGWCITLTGMPGERDGARGYVLTGTLGEPPAALRIPLIDDAPIGGVPE